MKKVYTHYAVYFENKFVTHFYAESHEKAQNYFLNFLGLKNPDGFSLRKAGIFD